MSKKNVYCDKCGAPRGLEVVAEKSVEVCSFCEKTKPCNVIEAKKPTKEKVVEDKKPKVSKPKVEKPKPALKKEPTKKVEKKPVEKKAAKKKATTKKK